MIDTADVLAKVRAGSMPASWRVIRPRGTRFIFSGALLLVAWYALISDLDSKSSLVAHYIPIPTLTWTVPTGSGFILTVVVMAAVLAFLARQFLLNRRRVLVLMPEGLVVADLRSGSIQRSVAYRDVDILALLQAGDGDFEPVPHVRLSFTFKNKQKMLWVVEDYFSLSAAEIARLVFADSIRTNTTVPANVQRPPAPDAAQIVAASRQIPPPEGWRIFTTKLAWKTCIVTILFAGILVFMYTLFVQSYFITGPSLPQRFNSGRPFGDVLASEMITIIALIFFTWLLGFYEINLIRRIQLARHQIIVAPTALVLADKRTGKPTRVLDYNAIPEVHLTQWFKVYTIRYRTEDGKRRVLLLPPDALSSPAAVCQSFLARYYRSRVKSNLA